MSRVLTLALGFGLALTLCGCSPNGRQVYQAHCAVCHDQGVGGAPVTGDRADWGPRLEKGESALVANAIHGFHGERGIMPPRGGANLSDAEVQAAVRYMIGQAR